MRRSTLSIDVMKSRLVPIISLFFLFSSKAVQAGVQQAWLAAYNGGLTEGTNRAVAMALDSQGNVVVAGSSTGEAGDFDYVVLKYAPNGSLVWANRYDSPDHGQDEVKAMKLDHDGAVVVCGTTKTIKLRNNGELEWAIDYPATSLTIDGANSIYLVGYRGTEFATIKVSASGTNAWERIKSFGNGPNFSQVVCLDSATNVYVAGWINCSPDPSDPSYRDDLIVSYDAQGNERWASAQGLVECIGGQVDIHSIAADSLGHVTYALNQISSIFAARSYDTGGTFRWEYAFDSGLGVAAMACDELGNCYLVGAAAERIGPDQYLFPYGTVKLDASGTKVWFRQYGSGEINRFHYSQAIGLDMKGNATVTGQSPGPGAGNDIATVQYSIDGNEKWVRRYDGPAHGDDGALALAVGPQGEVYVSGYQTTTINLVELIIIKYSERASIQMQPDKTAALQFIGTPGQSNRVQATTDFLDWLDLGFSVGDTNGLLHFQDTNAPSFPFRFYRTVIP